ncbi:hypothetical protein DMA11_02570 [Marinilabiliaceae bacterium JC017]|nr:hypothetical protein DMA11_02570 [Marinilabiliaceae bacterium JC017]
MALNHLKYDEINRLKWDSCIRQAFNGITYAYSWFLDIVCDEWEALVEDDYLTVMPLPIKKTWGIPMIFQPFWAHQLGIFSKAQMSPEKTELFLESIPYKNVSIMLNAYNRLPSSSLKKHTQEMTYGAIDLISSYSAIQKVLTPKISNKVSIAKKHSISVSRSIDANEYIQFKKQQKTKGWNPAIVKRIISFSTRYKSAGTYGAYNRHNELIAQAFFIKSNQRLLLIDTVASEEGEKKAGLYAIILHVIKNNAETNLTLEFPYSDQALSRNFQQTSHHFLQYKKGIGRLLDGLFKQRYYL